MNTVGIKNADSWAQFMKLTQDARVRNNSLSSVKNASSVKSTVVFQANQKSVVGSVNLYRAKEPQTKSPLLGGKFDAYA